MHTLMWPVVVGDRTFIRKPELLVGYRPPFTLWSFDDPVAEMGDDIARQGGDHLFAHGAPGSHRPRSAVTTRTNPLMSGFEHTCRHRSPVPAIVKSRPITRAGLHNVARGRRPRPRVRPLLGRHLTSAAITPPTETVITDCTLGRYRLGRPRHRPIPKGTEANQRAGKAFDRLLLELRIVQFLPRQQLLVAFANKRPRLAVTPAVGAIEPTPVRMLFHDYFVHSDLREAEVLQLAARALDREILRKRWRGRTFKRVPAVAGIFDHPQSIDHLTTVGLLIKRIQIFPVLSRRSSLLVIGDAPDVVLVDELGCALPHILRCINIEIHVDREGIKTSDDREVRDRCRGRRGFVHPQIRKPRDQPRAVILQ